MQLFLIFNRNSCTNRSFYAIVGLFFSKQLHSGYRLWLHLFSPHRKKGCLTSLRHPNSNQLITRLLIRSVCRYVKHGLAVDLECDGAVECDCDLVACLYLNDLCVVDVLALED